MRINPAEKLEALEEKILGLHNKIIELEANDIAPIYERQSLRKLNDQFDIEFAKTYDEYLALFSKYIYCTEDIQHMLDLDIQMVTKRMSPELDSIYFSKIMRRHIKSCRINKTHDELELLLYRLNIDIDKKVFFSIESLTEWLTNHVTTSNNISIPKALAQDMIKNKSDRTVLNTVNYKKEHNIKYDMQLKRINRQRLYFNMGDAVKRKLSRIPTDVRWDSIICKLNEL